MSRIGCLIIIAVDLTFYTELQTRHFYPIFEIDPAESGPTRFARGAHTNSSSDLIFAFFPVLINDRSSRSVLHFTGFIRVDQLLRQESVCRV